MRCTFLCFLPSLFTVPSIPAFPRHRLALHLGAALATLLPLTVHSAELPEVKVVGLQDSVMDSQTTVYDREALTSEGDGTLQEYLSRQPGVSVDANGYISLRGMGEGYTQVMVNGRKANSDNGDASIGDIPMGMIERVEIERGSSASESGTAVAGTIRIFTRQATDKPENTVSVRAGFSPQGQFDHSVSLSMGGKRDMLEWQTNTTLRQREYKVITSTVTSNDYGQGYVSEVRDDKGVKQIRKSLLMLSGEVAVRPDANNRIGLSWMANVSPESERARSNVDYRYDEPGYEDHHTEQSGWYNRTSPQWDIAPTLQWNRQLSNGGKFHAEIGTHQYGSTERYNSFDNNPYYSGEYSSHNRSRERKWHSALRFDLPLSAASMLTLGGRIERDKFIFTEIEDGESFSDTMKRHTNATFVQWNWRPSSQWSVETGLRREEIKNVMPPDSDHASRKNNLWLPSLNIAWTPNADQRAHLGLARTYRNPKLKEMIPGFYRDWGGWYQNPYLQGNPDLRHETSTGLELGFTQALRDEGKQVGKLSANVFARSISNALITELYSIPNPKPNQNQPDIWVLRSINGPRTRVLGLELGAQYDLKHTALQLPVNLNANLTLTETKVADGESPARLFGQSPAVLDLGFDARTQGGGLPDVWGMSVRLESGYKARMNPTTISQVRPLRSLSMRAMWKLNPSTRLRGTLGQFGNNWHSTAVTPADPSGGTSEVSLHTKRFWMAGLMLEKDF